MTMSTAPVSAFVLILVTSLSFSALRAQDAPSTTETRLRDALRNTMLQMRDAQNQVVTLQAAKDQADKDNADLKAKVDSLTLQLNTTTKEEADEKSTSDKAIADLNAKIADQAGQIQRLNDALAQWHKANDQLTQLYKVTEAARAQLAMQAALLQRTVDDREAKNLELFKTGNEILVRYEKFSLGDAISEKEPFVGLTRVKLENLVQDYKDKLLDGVVTPGQPITNSAPPATSNKPVTTTQAKSTTSTSQH